jgi:basic membrane protein A
LNVHSRNGISTTIGVAIVIVLLLAAAGAYYFVSTTGTSTTTTPTTTTTAAGPLPGKGMSIGVVFDIGGLGDKGFNDLAYAGMIQANKTLGVDYYYQIAKTTTDFASDYQALLNKHVNLIVGVGFDQDSVINTTARANPNQLFAQVDGDIFNVTNVISIKFEEHVGSAIVGALAVAETQTGKIAFYGAVSTGIIYKFWNGWKFGAQWADTYLSKVEGKAVNTTLTEKYAGATFDYFNNPQAGYQDGQAILQTGADIIFAAAGGTGLGTYKAVGQYDQNHGWNWSLSTAPTVYAIGVDANQDYMGTYGAFVKNTSSGYTAPSFMLTSEIKKVDVGVFDVMKSVVYNNYSNFWSQPSKWGGSWYNGAAQQCQADHVSPYGDQPCHVRNVFLLGLAQGAVGPTDFQYTSQYLTPLAKRVVAQIETGILNGSITVPEVYTYTSP